LNLRPSGYEPDELPGCSTPRRFVLRYAHKAIVRPPGLVLSGDLASNERYCWFLTRFGGDLLSHALRRSTIGAERFHGRVRDGIGCFTLAMTTKPSKGRPTHGTIDFFEPLFLVCLSISSLALTSGRAAPDHPGWPLRMVNQVDRTISTS
jgi:hypothetical protein